MVMNETFEAVLVTLAALAALVVLVRQYLPAPSANGQKPAPGCGNCSSHAPAPGAPPITRESAGRGV